MPSRLQTLKWLGDSLPSSSAKVNELLNAEGTLDSIVASDQNDSSAACNQAASSDRAASAAAAVASVNEARGAVGGRGITVTPNTSLHETLQQIAPGQVIKNHCLYHDLHMSLSNKIKRFKLAANC
jgi:hypothetical protein